MVFIGHIVFFLQHYGMIKDRFFHYKNTLPKVDGNNFVFPTIHMKAHIQTQFKTSVYVYKNGTKSESDYSKVKDMFNLNT